MAYALHRGIFTTSEAWKAFYNWRFEGIAYQNTFIAICDSAFTNMQQTVTDFRFILLNNFVTCVFRSLAHYLKLVSHFTVICYTQRCFPTSVQVEIIGFILQREEHFLRRSWYCRPAPSLVHSRSSYEAFQSHNFPASVRDVHLLFTHKTLQLKAKKVIKRFEII